jgi:5'-3' exonuclease
MSDIFLIDGNAVGFACHSGQKLMAGPMQTQAVFGIARTLRAMQLHYPRTYKTMLWDGRAQWRIDLYPDYKANRDSNPKMKAMREAYKAQRAYIETLVKALGIDQVKSPICEADDLAAAYAQYFSKQSKSVRLITADRDWLQLINANVCWHDPVRDRLITLETFEKETGFAHPKQIVDLKCLMGDTSDNIKGVGGIGEVGAKKLLHAYGSVEKLLALHGRGALTALPGPWEKLVTNEDGRLDRYRTNHTLMNLLGAAKPGVEKRHVTKGHFNPAVVREVAEDLAFHSILSDFDSWIKPFSRGTHDQVD